MATDVPGQLEALRDPDARGPAMRALYGNVYHQGSRFEASAAVVPFLVALVDDPATPERGSVLGLLTAITIGDRRDDAMPFDAAAAFAKATDVDDVELVERFYSEEDLTDDEVDRLDGLAVRWEADCYCATERHLPAITRWISDPDDVVAGHAAALSAWFAPTPAVVTALVDVPGNRGSADLALAHMPYADTRITPRLTRLVESEQSLTAAVALAYREGKSMPDAALSVLVDAADREISDDVVGWDRSLRGFVMLALQRVGLG